LKNIDFTAYIFMNDFYVVFQFILEKLVAYF